MTKPGELSFIHLQHRNLMTPEQKEAYSNMSEPDRVRFDNGFRRFSVGDKVIAPEFNKNTVYEIVNIIEEGGIICYYTSDESCFTNKQIVKYEGEAKVVSSTNYRDTFMELNDAALWGAATFPTSTVHDFAAKLVEEAEELQDKPMDVSEIADVAIVLASICRITGTNLAQAIHDKMIINRSRPRDTEGQRLDKKTSLRSVDPKAEVQEIVDEVKKGYTTHKAVLKSKDNTVDTQYVHPTTLSEIANTLHDTLEGSNNNPSVGFTGRPSALPQANDSGLDILDEARSLVNGDRRTDYGPLLPSFERIAQMWSSVFDITVSPKQVALAMVCLKACRATQGYKRDSLVDMAAYAYIIDRLQQESEARGAEVNTP